MKILVFCKVHEIKNVFSFHENISKGDSTESLAIELFSKLPRNLTEQLYELYKIDFEMFEYDSKPYMGKPIKKPKPKIKVRVISTKLSDDSDESVDLHNVSHDTLNNSMDFDMDQKSEDQEVDTNIQSIKS